MNKIEKYSHEQLYSLTNPFTINLKIPVNERPGRKKKMPDGEVKFETYYVERAPHTRIYTTFENSKKIYSLSGKALSMLFYVFHCIEQNKDYVQLNPEHFKSQVGRTADNTFLDAKKELIAKGFIASTGIYRTVFWINPNIFFPGNRINKYKDLWDIKPFQQPGESKEATND